MKHENKPWESALDRIVKHIETAPTKQKHTPGPWFATDNYNVLAKPGN